MLNTLHSSWVSALPLFTGFIVQCEIIDVNKFAMLPVFAGFIDQRYLGKIIRIGVYCCPSLSSVPGFEPIFPKPLYPKAASFGAKTSAEALPGWAQVQWPHTLDSYRDLMGDGDIPPKRKARMENKMEHGHLYTCCFGGLLLEEFLQHLDCRHW